MRDNSNTPFNPKGSHSTLALYVWLEIMDKLFSKALIQIFLGRDSTSLVHTYNLEPEWFTYDTQLIVTFGMDLCRKLQIAY